MDINPLRLGISGPIEIPLKKGGSKAKRQRSRSLQGVVLIGAGKSNGEPEWPLPEPREGNRQLSIRRGATAE